jgi:hypothetical protein
LVSKRQTFGEINRAFLVGQTGEIQWDNPLLCTSQEPQRQSKWGNCLIGTISKSKTSCLCALLSTIAWAMLDSRRAENREEARFDPYLVEDGGQDAISDQIPSGRIEGLCKVSDELCPRSPHLGMAIYHEDHLFLRIERWINDKLLISGL